MSSKDCRSKRESNNVDFDSAFRCRICRKSFKKFIIFEGHFAFNAKCRAKGGWFMQCYVCGETFRHLAVLKYHLRGHLNRRNEFKQNINQRTNDQSSETLDGLRCNFCERNFSTNIQLNEHMTSHSKNAITKKAQVNGHDSSIETVNQSTLSSCQICSIDCLDSSALETHMTTHHTLSCESCKLTYTSEVSLKFHQKLFHPSPSNIKPKQNQRSQYQCGICAAKFSFSCNLTRHIQVHTVGDVECKICHIRFTKLSLDLHTKEAHPELGNDDVSVDELQKSEQKEEPDDVPENVESTSFFQCKICKRNFVKKNHRDQHEKVHEGTFKCQQCQILFTRKTLKTHKCTFPVDEKTTPLLECNICKKRFSCHSHQVQHARIHNGGFKCEECQIPFTKMAFVAHLNRYHPEKRLGKTGNSYACNICKKNFNCRSHLIHHERIHRGSFKCKKCQIPFTKSALESHTKRFHPEQRHESVESVEAKGMSYACKDCKKRFNSHSHLVRHRLVHRGAYKCEICSIPFKLSALKAHNARHHADERDNKSVKNAPPNNYSKKKNKDSPNGKAGEDSEKNIQKFEESSDGNKCNLCHKVCNSASNLGQHKRIHTQGERKCEICNVNFTQNTIKAHRLLCQSNVRIRIVETPKSIISEEEVDSRNGKEGENSEENIQKFEESSNSLFQNVYKCNLCHKVCNFAVNLEQHKRIHTRGGWKCEICNVNFTQSTIKAHQLLCRQNVRIVETPKPIISEEASSRITFNCNQCDESFTLNHYLNIHLKSHHRQYSCNICDEAFNGRDNLRTHYASHIFECYVCKNQTFPSTKVLAAHIKKHIVYEQWVDPINVYLSNWSPTKSREILQNQPLVLVENLNINNMNMNFSVSFNRANEGGPGKVKNETEISRVTLSIEDVKLELPTIVNGGFDELPSCHINIELKQPINADNEKELRSPSNGMVELASLSDLEEVHIVEQQPDTTTVVYADDQSEVIDVSSESDVGDILELFHCYFCNETFRSLDSLGVHVKTCSFCP